MKKGTYITALGEVVDLVMGQAPPSKDTNFDGRGTPFVKVGEFGPSRPVIREWTTNPLRMARRTDVLLCVVGATCGKINLGEECAIGRSVAAIRPHPEKLDQFYLYYFMMTLVERLRSGSVGAAQTVISKEMVGTIQVPVPPLTEQQRIVGLLDEAFAGLATAQTHAERNHRNALALFESHLQFVFTQRGNGWPIAKLGDLTDLVTKGTTPTSIGHAFVPSGINFVKVESITTAGQFIEEKFAHITPECHAALGRSQLKAGDILFSIAGALGRTAFVPQEILPANTNQALAIVRLRQNAAMSSKFVLMALETGVVLEQIESFRAGAAQQNLSLAQVRDFQIATPPLPEQEAIVDEITSLREESQRLAKLYERKQAALAALKQSLLHKAFGGNL